MSKARRLDVMLSSTSKDLPDHRAQGARAAARAGYYVVQMENLTAMPQGNDAISVSMAMVEEAEVYIGIIGMRYGFRPKDARNPNEISITEMEYRRAKELEMPILIFIMDEEHPGPDTSGMNASDAHKAMKAFYEDDPRGEEKLDLLKKELKAHHIVAFFTSPEDLYGHVLAALQSDTVRQAAKQYAERRESEAAGASEAGRTPSAPKATIPFPPELYAYPPYSGQSALFIGRKQELHMLSDWALHDTEHPLLLLEAIGGMGKSALTWRWVQDEAVPFDGVFWYSFYEGGALMDEFVRHALAYVTRRDPEDLKTPNRAKLLAELIEALKGGRYLLVLDGLERVLVAYHRWDAAQMQDDEVEEGQDVRACTNPRDEDVLRQLAAVAPSRVLISSRLMPTALGDAGEYLNGVRREELRGLSREDARRLWQERGITWGDDGVLDGFMQQIGYHSLLLKIMVDVIKKNRRTNGDFDRWYEFHGDRFDPFSDVKVKRHHILEFAYDGLSEDGKTLLSQMAALGSALDAETLNVFNPYINAPDVVQEPNSELLAYMEQRQAEGETRWDDRIHALKRQKADYEAYLQEKTAYEKSAEYRDGIRKFDELLADLENRGLIWWDTKNQQFDLHPVVRGYAYTQLSEEERPATYDRLFNFFEEQERGNKQTRFGSLKEMQNLLAMYKALLGAGNYDAAANLFINRMRLTLVQEGLGLYHLAYELLLPFFSNGLDELPNVSTPYLQSFMLNQMGLVLRYLGRREDALLVRALEVKIELEQENWSNLQTSLHNISFSLASNNQLAEALKATQLALQLARVRGDDKGIVAANYALLNRYSDLARWGEARAAYEHVATNSPKDLVFVWVTILMSNVVLRKGAPRSEVEALLDQAEGMNERVQSMRDARLLLTLRGDLALREGEPAEAIPYYADAARIGNEQGVRDASAWSGLARAYAASGQLEKALRIVRDGAGHYAAAVVYLASGDHAAAQEAVLEFYNWAWAQGEPYVRRWHLEQARELLQQLGEPEPDLPTWDESQYEPFPHEEEVVALIERLKQEKAQDEE